MQDLFIRFKYWGENTTNKILEYIPSLYELYEVMLVLLLIAGFIKIVVLNKRYKVLRFYLKKILDTVF